jgi:hypothetical protein
MVKVIRYIIYSKNKYTGKETTTGHEYYDEAIAYAIAENLDRTFVSYTHRVEMITRVATLDEE